MMTTRPAEELTLHDRLSHLTYAQACRLLGPRAKELLRAGGALEIRLDEQCGSTARCPSASARRSSRPSGVT